MSGPEAELQPRRPHGPANAHAVVDAVSPWRPSSCANRTAPVTSPHAVALVSACLLALVVGGIPFARAGTDLDGHVVRLAPDDMATVARGETLYRENCASCHGSGLEGQPDWRVRDADGRLPAPPHDASGHTWHHDDDLLFEIVKYGPGAVIGDPAYRSAMPAYEALMTDDEIVAALSYIVSSWPDEQRDYQREINASRFGDDAPGAKDSLLERLFR